MITDIQNDNFDYIVNGNINHLLIFLPYLKINKPLFDTVFFSDYKYIRTLDDGSHSFYEIHKTDVDDNHLAENIIEKTYIDTATLFVKKTTNELDFRGMHQYTGYEFSDVENLGSNAKQEFKLNKILQEYSVFDYMAESRAAADKIKT